MEGLSEFVNYLQKNPVELGLYVASAAGIAVMIRGSIWNMRFAKKYKKDGMNNGVQEPFNDLEKKTLK
jgi:hypothetical protein